MDHSVDASHTKWVCMCACCSRPKPKKCSRPLCVHPFLSFSTKKRNNKSTQQVSHIFFSVRKKANFFSLVRLFCLLKNSIPKAKNKKKTASSLIYWLNTLLTFIIHVPSPLPLITNSSRNIGVVIFLLFDFSFFLIHVMMTRGFSFLSLLCYTKVKWWW